MPSNTEAYPRPPTATQNELDVHDTLVGNLMMDGFTTQIGTELYYRPGNGVLAMIGATNGEIRGTVFTPNSREAAYLGLPFRWPRPDPVRIDLATRTYPKEQPYIHRLTHLGDSLSEDRQKVSVPDSQQLMRGSSRIQ